MAQVNVTTCRDTPRHSHTHRCHERRFITPAGSRNVHSLAPPTGFEPIQGTGHAVSPSSSQGE